jgi:Cu/Ag efflux protein CusF
MLRSWVAALIAVLVCTSGLFADVFEKTRVKKVDADKSILTVTIDGKDQEFSVAADARIFKTTGSGKKVVVEDLPGGLKGLKQGDTVSVWTEPKGGKEVVTQVKLEGAKKGK